MSNETTDVSRRAAAAGFLSALGIVALSSCADGQNADGEVVADLTGTTACWVDTLANLKTVAHPASGTTDSKIAILEGYTTAFDGGGGVFCWDHTSTATNNNGTIVRPNDVAVGSAGRWRRVYSGPVNVRWFGAVGSGVGNDAAAIQAAIDEAIVTGKEVVLPAGTYPTGTTVLTTSAASGAKLTIAGAGKRITRITRTAGSATSTLNIQLTGPSVVEIRDLTIDGPTGLAFDNASVGINWITGDATHRLRVERVEITGTHDAAIQNSCGGKVELVDCDLEATDACVGMFSSVALPDGNGAHILVRGGTWRTPNGDLSSAGSVGLYVHPHIPYKVEGVTFEKIGRYGIYQNGSWTDARGPAVATGCRFINCAFAQTKGNGVSDFSGCVIQGTSNPLNSNLDGRVNITGCTFDRGPAVSYGPGTFSKVIISGCLFVDTAINTAGNAGNRWSLRDSTVVVTDAAPNWAGVTPVNGVTDLENVTFVDETTRLPTDPLQYQTFVRMTISAPVVKARGCRFRDGHGSITSGFYVASGTLTVDDCEFSPAARAEAIWVIVGSSAGVLDGENNRFNGGAFPYVAAGQQTLTRRRARNPNTVASATSIDTSASAFANYDTHVVTGSATIQNLTNTLAFTGVIRLVVGTGASWATGNGGNIAPKTTAPRATNAVVELLWEPLAGKWLEV